VAAANFTSHRSGFSPTQQPRGSNIGNRPSRQQGQHRSSNGPSQDQRCNNISGCPTSNNIHFQPKCQYCDQMGHTTKTCPKLQYSEMTTNCAGTLDGQENKWLIDSVTSHNILGDLQNLSIHSEYDNTDEVLIGDGTSLAITHIGSLASPTPKFFFIYMISDVFPIFIRISFQFITSPDTIIFFLNFTHFIFL
jgi:hypothetical protein